MRVGWYGTLNIVIAIARDTGSLVPRVIQKMDSNTSVRLRHKSRFIPSLGVRRYFRHVTAISGKFPSGVILKWEPEVAEATVVHRRSHIAVQFAGMDMLVSGNFLIQLVLPHPEAMRHDQTQPFFIDVRWV